MTSIPDPRFYDQDSDKIADSYLDHILLALEVEDRGAPYRNFLDNWYAYRRAGHYLTSRGLPFWIKNACVQKHGFALREMDFISTGAEEVLELAYYDSDGYRRARDQKDKSVRLIVDHAIPIRVLIANISFEPAQTRKRLRAYLNENYRLGVITRAEHVRLGAAGLVSNVPRAWDGSPFARYAHADISGTASDKLG